PRWKNLCIRRTRTMASAPGMQAPFDSVMSKTCAERRRSLFFFAHLDSAITATKLNERGGVATGRAAQTSWAAAFVWNHRKIAGDIPLPRLGIDVETAVHRQCQCDRAIAHLEGMLTLCQASRHVDCPVAHAQMKIALAPDDPDGTVGAMGGNVARRPSDADGPVVGSELQDGPRRYLQLHGSAAL